MGEAKRRKVSLNDLFDQAQGVFEGRLYFMRDVVRVIPGILTGANPKSTYDRGILLAIGEWFKMLGTRQYRKPPLCLLCDNTFLWQKRAPAAFFWILPHRTDLATLAGSLSAICPTCANKPPEELEAACQAKMKASLIPDLRVIIEINENAGKA